MVRLGIGLGLWLTPRVRVWAFGIGLGVWVRVRLGLGFRSGQSQCVPPFRSVDYHIFVKSGTRRSHSVPPFRSGNYTNPSVKVIAALPRQSPLARPLCLDLCLCLDKTALSPSLPTVPSPNAQNVPCNQVAIPMISMHGRREEVRT